MSITKRSIVYIDGFNLYYGALKGTRSKWLDLSLLFKRLRPHDEICQINYFTAEALGPKGERQNQYLQALTVDPLVTIFLGIFKRKNIQCRVDQCEFRGRRWFHVLEEKRTDVAIAVQMLDDAYQDLADRFILVSGDSDLVPPVLQIKRRFPEKQVIVYVPATDKARGAAVELRNVADKDRTLPNNLIRQSQLSAKLPDGYGGWIEKPDQW